MNYTIIRGYQHDSNLRKSFNELAIKTFGLNFENWFQSGYWKEKYIPYSIIYNNKIIANVSASLMDFKYLGKEKHYIQLDTVMTDKKYRNQGLSKMLIERIKSDFANSDGMFLYANDSVLSFYPKFGFKSVAEYRYMTDVTIKTEKSIIPVPMNTKKDWSAFLKIYKEYTSYGLLEINCDDILMFYLTQFMKNSVYYIKRLDIYVIAEIEDDTLILYDILSNTTVNLKAVYEAFGKDIKKVIFNFVPKDVAGLTKFLVNDKDTTFFLLGSNIEEDMKSIKSLPELAKA